MKKVLLLLLACSVILVLSFFLIPSLKAKISRKFNEMRLEEVNITVHNLKGLLHERAELNKIPFEELPFTGAKNNYDLTIEFTGKSPFKAKAKLQGIYNDHWKYDRYSFKVKSSEVASIYGDNTFSLMHPSCRDILGDWIASKIEQKRGLNSLRRHFIKGYVNDEYKGVYLYEERASKSFFKSRGLKEGVIFKVYLDDLNDLNPRYKWYTKNSDSTLVKNLIRRFLADSTKGFTPFNIELMSEHYAITDLVQGHHQLIDFNSFFYYQKETGKIALIGREWNSLQSLNKVPILSVYKVKEMNNIHTLILQNNELRAAYSSKLKIMSKFDLELFFSEIEEEISMLEKVLWYDLGGNSFDRSYLYKNQEFLKDLLRDDK